MYGPWSVVSRGVGAVLLEGCGYGWEGYGWWMRLGLNLDFLSLFSYLFLMEALLFERQSVTLSCKAVVLDICPHAFSSIPLFATNGIMSKNPMARGFLSRPNKEEGFLNVIFPLFL